MLKFKIDNLDDVEEAQRGLYKETKDGEKTIYVLQVDGAVDIDTHKKVQGRVSEFRANNVKLTNAIGVFRKHYGDEIADDTPIEEYESILKAHDTELSKSASVGKPRKEEIEQIVNTRISAIEKQHKDALEAIKKERDQNFARLEQIEIENAIIGEATKRGMKPEARLDVISRGRQIFSYVDGKVIAVDEHGEQRYTESGGLPLTVEAFVDELSSKTGKHLFDQNSGGGANGSGGAGSKKTSGPNPWSKDHWNITRQFEIQKSDPATATRLKAEVGAK